MRSLLLHAYCLQDLSFGIGFYHLCYILDHMFQQYLCSHGLISYESGLTIMNECDFDNYVFPEPQNVTVQCNPAISQANKIVGEYVIVDVCCPSIVQQELRLQKMATKISVGGYVCMTYERRSYLNLSEIQKAVHTNRTNFLIVGVCAVSRE